MTSNFYIPESEILYSRVTAIWESKGTPCYSGEMIIPKGVVEIIFDLGKGKPLPVTVNQKLHYTGSCFINGFNTGSIQLNIKKEHHFLGIQFQPYMTRKLFNIPAGEFSNSLVDLALIDPGIQVILYQLKSAISFEEKKSIIIDWIKGNKKESDARELAINRFLSNTCYNQSTVSGLANEFCYSSRQLARKFQEYTGMNTEDLLLYRKYLHSVQLLHNTRHQLTSIAYDAGFSDQSHFIKTFRSFTGLTPGEYRCRMSSLPGHIYQVVR